jgi:hypothetical protein
MISIQPTGCDNKNGYGHFLQAQGSLIILFGMENQYIFLWVFFLMEAFWFQWRYSLTNNCIFCIV